MQQNQISRIEFLENKPNLIIIDIAMNQITTLDGLENNAQLMEIWANQNKIESLEVFKVLEAHKELETVYFGHNPIAQ